MATTLAASTTRIRDNYVHMAFRAAVRDKIIREAPSDGVAFPKVAKAETTMLIQTPEQAAAARGACLDPAFVGFIAVCAYAGPRLAEAAGLQVGDVDFLRREIRVRGQVQGQTRTTAKVVPPNAGSARTVYVSDDLIELLSRHVRDIGSWGEDAWLFGVGALLNRNAAGHLWRQTSELVGPAAFALHDLRHFDASGLITAGCDVVTVQHALGHSTPTITLNTYSRTYGRRLRTGRGPRGRLCGVLRTVCGLMGSNMELTCMFTGSW